MAYNNDDKPKKSWRELDKMRESSQHRPNKGQDRLERSNEYRSYKSQLNKLFESKTNAPANRESLKPLLEASTPSEMKKALEAYRSVSDFPQDEEVLGKLLDLGNESVVLETLHVLHALALEQKLKRAASLKTRLKTVQITYDDPDILEIAAQVLKTLH